MKANDFAGSVLLRLIIAMILVTTARASDMQETNDFGVVQKKAMELGKEHGPENVLLVFDIDNTLLAANQPLGSDQWFDWQEDLLDEEPDPMRMADDLGGLLRAQGILFALGRMHPPQEKQPGIVKELQARGFRTLLLTSRGPANRDATMRQLKECGYSVADSAPRLADGFCGVRLPYSLKDVGAAGLSAEEAERLHLGVPREVSYDQGVFMTAGQNKGAMLRILMAHCPRHFSAVIFVDDKSKHTERVFSALAGRGIDVFTYRYSAEDDEVKAFSEEQKQNADRQWKRLAGTLEEILQ